jgi:hypothetical protein
MFLLLITYYRSYVRAAWLTVALFCREYFNFEFDEFSYHVLAQNNLISVILTVLR